MICICTLEDSLFSNRRLGEPPSSGPLSGPSSLPLKLRMSSRFKLSSKGPGTELTRPRQINKKGTMRNIGETELWYGERRALYQWRCFDIQHQDCPPDLQRFVFLPCLSGSSGLHSSYLVHHLLLRNKFYFFILFNTQNTKNNVTLYCLPAEDDSSSLTATRWQCALCIILLFSPRADN